jgi:hypothetical protein
MRALLRKIILWALDIKDQGSNAEDLDQLASELKK